MEAQSYLDRKIAGICTYPGCTRDAALGVQLCPRHRRRQNQRKAESSRRLSAERRAAGLCATGCGAKSETFYCTACMISRGRLSTVATHNTLDKSARLAARTITGADGRTRYHGQSRRGSQPPEQLVDGEIRDAIKLLETTQRGLAMAYALPAGTPSERTRRKAAIHASLAHADRVSRQIEEICQRYGYQQTALQRDRDCDEDV